jgi:hypothetical protein
MNKLAVFNKYGGLGSMLSPNEWRSGANALIERGSATGATVFVHGDSFGGSLRQG